jgi:L-asparaginase / beta-aspartyl-peptidase
VHEGRTPEVVALEAMAYLKARADGHGGIILLDRQGRIGLAHNTPRMAYSYKTSAAEAVGINLLTV